MAELLPLFRDHLPKTISDIAFEDVHEKVPRQYIKNAIASCLASKIVYKEGCSFINGLPQDQLARIAMQYISKEKELCILKDALYDTVMAEEERDSIIQILDAGGVRAALKI